ncbi:hypothetical protein HYV74_01875 [Candidatus Uhrbacteria bacterium]|nr:hypothetical protein [Candidatus Uhrbacteria bacterium]
MTRARQPGDRPSRRRRGKPTLIAVMVGIRESATVIPEHRLEHAGLSVAQQHLRRADIIAERIDAWLRREGLRAIVEFEEKLPMIGAVHYVIPPALKQRLLEAFPEYLVEGSDRPVRATPFWG